MIQPKYFKYNACSCLVVDVDPEIYYNIKVPHMKSSVYTFGVRTAYISLYSDVIAEVMS